MAKVYGRDKNINGIFLNEETLKIAELDRNIDKAFNAFKKTEEYKNITQNMNTAQKKEFETKVKIKVKEKVSKEVNVYRYGGLFATVALTLASVIAAFGTAYIGAAVGGAGIYATKLLTHMGIRKAIGKENVEAVVKSASHKV